MSFSIVDTMISRTTAHSKSRLCAKVVLNLTFKSKAKGVSKKSRDFCPSLILLQVVDSFENDKNEFEASDVIATLLLSDRWKLEFQVFLNILLKQWIEMN